MKNMCPSCQKPLLSGLSPLCGYCGAKLPAEVLFSPAQKAAVEAEELATKRALEESEKENAHSRTVQRLKISGVGGGVVAAAKVVGALTESRLGKKA